MDTPYRTAEQIAGMQPLAVDPAARRALTQAPGLENMAGSMVPGTARHHVRSPQQTAVDPAAAGLDTTRVVVVAGHARAGSAAVAPEPVDPPASTPAITDAATVPADPPATA
ncbi:hypothetical protein [Acetobacter sp.]|uniref:hypothetical protein n=1 Tax=Acetobacter sp. TaxID=440 RepID=UPI0039EA03CA